MSEELRHEGFYAARLAYDNPREIAFATQWKEENKRHHILAHLLMQGEGIAGPCYQKVTEHAPYNQQSASIAATVIQWLGSNVGFDFLRQCIEKAGYTIEKVKP